MGDDAQNWISGKTCIITGGNSGIGKATAIALAKMGATVIIVSRDKAKGEAAREDILASSGAGPENVALMIADLASLDSVRQLAADFLKANAKLNVLINNAGLILGSRTVTKDGLETTFEVNYLSHFLLTNLLLGALKAAAPSRIINVTSDAQSSGHIDFDDLQEEKRYGALRSYSQSKLAQVLFTYELARRLQGTGVTANCVHPGLIASNWGRHDAGALSIVLRLFGGLMPSPEKAAVTSIYLASSPDVANVTGKFFAKKAERRSSDESYNQVEAKRLWDVSLALSKLPADAQPV